MVTLAPILLLTCLTAGTSAQQLLLNQRDPVVAAQIVTDGILNAREYLTDVDMSKFSKYAKSAMFGEFMDLEFLKDNVTECGSSLVQFGSDLSKLKQYSLKMVDAWGKVSSGIERGNLVWMGRYYECLDAHSQNFSGKWCLLSFGSPQKQVQPTQSIAPSIGMCLPSTCSQGQITGIFHTIAQNMSASVYCPVQPTEYTTTEKVFLVIASFLGVLMLFGTCYEAHTIFSLDRQQYHQILNDGELVKPLQETQSSLFGEILLSFSVIKSTRQILDTSQKEGNINVLHGIRFISMTWVVMGHAFSFGVQFYDNILDFAEDIVTSTSYEAIVNATYSVDTFFFLSGLLATYLGMREMERSNGKVRVFTAYLYRYLRLTPAYALCILGAYSIYSKMGDGPMWPKTMEGLQAPCSKYWWANLIYINNLYPTGLGDECFGHGWYLANDMQFFLLSPFILLLLFKKPNIGRCVLAIGLFCSVAITLGLSLHYKEQPMVVSIGNLCKMALGALLGVPSSDTPYDANVTTPAPPPATPTATDKFFSDLYTKPWCRIGVYLIGMATGYYLHKTSLRVRMNKIFALIMWAVAAVTALAVLYGLTPHVKGTEISLMSNGAAAFYNAVCRPLWALSLSWLVIACVSGYGGPINAFLSWKFFIPLSRLTYCAYLVHPMVIYWLFSSAETRFHYSIASLTISFLGLLLLSYGIAFVVSITIEMPMIRIMKLLFPHKKAKHYQPQPIMNDAVHTNA